MRRLQELQVLPKFFEVAETDLLDLKNGETIAVFSTHGAVDRIAERISEWRPRSHDGAMESEASLARWLTGGLKTDDELSTATLVREALIGEFERPLRADILLQFARSGGDQRSAIELVRVRNRRDFFSQLGRAQRLGVPTILVLVGVPDKLSRLEPDIRALSAFDVSIRVLSVALDDG